MTDTATPQSDGLVGRILKNVGFLFGGKTSAVLIGLAVLASAKLSCKDLSACPND